jgi:hypothetical protein
MSRSRVWSIPAIEDKAKQFCNQVTQVLALAPRTPGASRWKLLSYNDRSTGKGGIGLTSLGLRDSSCSDVSTIIVNSFILFCFHSISDLEMNYTQNVEIDWYGKSCLVVRCGWISVLVRDLAPVPCSLFPSLLLSLFGSFKRFSFLVCSPAYLLKFHWVSQLHLGWVSLPVLWQKLST